MQQNSLCSKHDLSVIKAVNSQVNHLQGRWQNQDEEEGKPSSGP
ncbi:hypothetical protein X975_11782, partial [Stegodyphus mimosarum]